MLSMHPSDQGSHNSVNRRAFLSIASNGLGIGGLAQALAAVQKNPTKPCILIWLGGGGASHGDSFDPKLSDPDHGSIEPIDQPEPGFDSITPEEWHSLESAVEGFLEKAQEHIENCFGYQNEACRKALDRLRPLLARISALAEVDNVHTHLGAYRDRERGEVMQELQTAALLLTKSGVFDRTEPHTGTSPAGDSTLLLPGGQEHHNESRNGR